LISSRSFAESSTYGAPWKPDFRAVGWFMSELTDLVAISPEFFHYDEPPGADLSMELALVYSVG